MCSPGADVRNDGINILDWDDRQDWSEYFPVNVTIQVRLGMSASNATLTLSTTDRPVSRWSPLLVQSEGLFLNRRTGPCLEFLLRGSGYVRNGDH